ncbi:MAG: hypothetical protein IT210_08650 [Armatimonadetes bacterium]|nr:hypothetical protein [Armatimonadota bacterium]
MDSFSLWGACLLIGCMGMLAVAPAEAAAPRKTLYVSKLGDNSDGSSWTKAFHTVQTALSAIPDGRGGYRIIVRPDTYFEDNLASAHRGAKRAYNELIGDFDGSLGSGRKGWVIIDSGDPGQQGFKSYDWWGTTKAYSKGWSAEHTDPTFSAIVWDRWRLSRLYVTGGDGGFMFDCTDRVEPFSVVVEDCVSIGRAFGGGAASCLSRYEEPITFRRCWLYALDWWGDTGAAYIRVENKAMPEKPDAVFEDCVMVSPQCALKGGNFGFATYMRVRLNRCRLVVLNFSQPQGTPTDGIIQSVEHGKYLRVDLEDTTLMGYKVFGVRVNKESAGDLGYSAKGDVKAYVQYQQTVPAGIHRMPHWPADIFQEIAPPKAPENPPVLANREIVHGDMCEISPFTWEGRLCHMECVRPGSGGKTEDYYLLLKDAETGKVMARLATGYGLASILIHNGEVFVFASRWENGGWYDVTLFRSRDLKEWQSKVAIRGENEMLFNSTVCKGPKGFVMAYESNDPAYPAFTTKFARSKDLENWEKLPESTFGTNRYTACPCIRYAGGYYYVMYAEHRAPRHFYETYITRSKDLRHWELSSANPVLRAEGVDEGINNSDPEIVEFEGKTYLYFAVGDQLTWMKLKRAVYPGPMKRFFADYFKTPAIPDYGSMVYHEKK